MDVKQFDEKIKWDEFLTAQKASFLQSKSWGEMLGREGKIVTRMSLSNEGAELAVAQVVEEKLPFGIKYGFCPGGPVLLSDLTEKEMIVMCKRFEEMARERGLVFLRVEPAVAPVGVVFNKIKDVNPSTTLVLDLAGTQEEYLESLDKKIRYEINQAKKKGVSVIAVKNLEIFLPLLSETSRHDRFSTHTATHYEKILDSPNSRQLVAYFQGEPVASAIFWQWGDTITYLFAATSRRFGHLSASYLIQEKIISLARAEGLRYYDFFGIAPRIAGASTKYEYDRNHRYAGFTKFKLGFGGRVVERAGTYEIIISPLKYKFYNFQRWLRSLL